MLLFGRHCIFSGAVLPRSVHGLTRLLHETFRVLEMRALSKSRTTVGQQSPAVYSLHEGNALSTTRDNVTTWRMGKAGGRRALSGTTDRAWTTATSSCCRVVGSYVAIEQRSAFKGGTANAVHWVNLGMEADLVGTLSATLQFFARAWETRINPTSG
jgi:hypothetical protein